MSAVLFGEVEFEEARAKNLRPKIDLEPYADMVATLQKAQEVGKRVTVAVRDQLHYETMTDVLYSIGSHLNASILPALIKRQDDGKDVRVKTVEEATHVRITVGKKRGVKPGQKILEPPKAEFSDGDSAK